MRRANYERESETVAFSGFLNAERQRILAAATPERRAQMEAAEESRAVYRAWNAVCSGTREGRHVTGLRYLPESNELLVYLDSPSWTQEMTLLREIIRARMERAGAHVDGLVLKMMRGQRRPPPRSACTRRRLSARRLRMLIWMMPSARKSSAKWHPSKTKNCARPSRMP
ncbi:MAG: DciA family protein [Collinsella sp.]